MARDAPSPILRALEKSMRESEAREHMLDAIASSRGGGVIGWAKTSDILLAAYHDGTTHADTIDLPHGTITQVHGARVI